MLLKDDLANAFIGECIIWKQKFKNECDLSKNIVKTVDKCTEITLPTIRNLLLILATFPVSNAIVERTFSSLYKIKTWQRSTLGEERPTGLALLLVSRNSFLSDLQCSCEKNGERCSVTF